MDSVDNFVDILDSVDNCVDIEDSVDICVDIVNSADNCVDSLDSVFMCRYSVLCSYLFRYSGQCIYSVLCKYVCRYLEGARDAGGQRLVADHLDAGGHGDLLAAPPALRPALVHAPVLGRDAAQHQLGHALAQSLLVAVLRVAAGQLVAVLVPGGGWGGAARGRAAQGQAARHPGSHMRWRQFLTQSFNSSALILIKLYLYNVVLIRLNLRIMRMDG